MIELINVNKSFDSGQTLVVKNFNLTILDHEFIVLLGSSGCGKTTSLKMINRLIEPSSGEIKIDGKSIREMNRIKLKRSIGYAFQGVGLFPHMTVEENISIVLKLMGKSTAYRVKRAHNLLELVNLDPKLFANRYIQELSGGQKQRVGVARCLANDPNYLLMDEPFGALDSITRDGLQEELLRLNSELKKTIVFVTHDIFEAFRLADRIVVMHEGQIEQVGTKNELLNHPKSKFVHDLLQKPQQQLEEFATSHE